MSFWEDFVTLCERVNLLASDSEEHNRYAKPPGDVSPLEWGISMFKSKYGDFRSLDKSPRYKGDKEI